MTSAPPIILTKLDLQRLERLLDSLDDYGPAAEALEQELSRAQVVERSEMPAGVVTMNSPWHSRASLMIFARAISSSASSNRIMRIGY